MSFITTFGLALTFLHSSSKKVPVKVPIIKLSKILSCDISFINISSNCNTFLASNIIQSFNITAIWLQLWGFCKIWGGVNKLLWFLSVLIIFQQLSLMTFNNHSWIPYVRVREWHWLSFRGRSSVRISFNTVNEF